MDDSPQVRALCPGLRVFCGSTLYRVMSDSHSSVLAAIALGSNLGDRAANLRESLDALDRAAQIRVDRVSEMIETEPVGVTDQPKFLNAAALVHTTLGPLELLRTCHAIERALGRDRGLERRWGPRTIDLDLLLYGDWMGDSEGLTVPHPRMAERVFVLLPLSFIAPGMVIPGRGMTVSDALIQAQRRENRATLPTS